MVLYFRQATTIEQDQARL